MCSVQDLPQRSPTRRNALMKRNSPVRGGSPNLIVRKPARELTDIVEEEKAAREKESQECQAVAGHVEASLTVLEKLQSALDEQEIDILKLKSEVKGKQRALTVFKDREAWHLDDPNPVDPTQRQPLPTYLPTYL
jgi:hypothetical protein